MQLDFSSVFSAPTKNTGSIWSKKNSGGLESFLQPEKALYEGHVYIKQRDNSLKKRYLVMDRTTLFLKRKKLSSKISRSISLSRQISMKSEIFMRMGTIFSSEEGKEN